ncbi:ribose-phosphate pyrophosphokinase-like domain-containing protein, partial [Patescibacteria group bacterium]|nr:ribose-phosphate pyrophosphokinase-like domain-containing protein [Patescibacteria group bacterium]
MAKLMIFSGSSHGDLAAAIAKKMGVPLSKTQISRFACG